MTYSKSVKKYFPYTEVEGSAADLAYNLLKQAGMPTLEDKESQAELVPLPAHPHQYMTPYRLSHYLQFWYRQEDMPRFTYFQNEDPEIDQIVVVQPIDFWACCSHHMLPFFGKIYFGYIPDKLLVGLSMVPLLAKSFCARPWVQEAMTSELADLFCEKLNPKGLGIISVATHTCQMLDLGGPPVPQMKFSEMRGAFRNQGPRTEFLEMITCSL